MTFHASRSSGFHETGRGGFLHRALQERQAPRPVRPDNCVAIPRREITVRVSIRRLRAKTRRVGLIKLVSPPQFDIGAVCPAPLTGLVRRVLPDFSGFLSIHYVHRAAGRPQGSSLWCEAELGRIRHSRSVPPLRPRPRSVHRIGLNPRSLWWCWQGVRKHRCAGRALRGTCRDAPCRPDNY